jgi:aryl-alcohol dehydrogenase-like predicted oxidoreductase
MPGGKLACRVGIGCWPIGGPDENLGMPMGWSTATDNAARAGLERAFELGANLFDTADVYGHGHSERLIATLLAQVPREEVIVCGKTGYFAGTAPHAYDPRHMRRQLEQTLDNLKTDYLDLYALHNNNFGPGDRYLAGAIDAIRTFQREGLVRGLGMRGPHRYAPDRLTAVPREDKYARFRMLFGRVRPDVLAVRFNLLTPDRPDRGIFEFAAEHGVPVLVTKPLAQGLLTGKHTASAPPSYGPGDHRTRKRWFSPSALAVLEQELSPLQGQLGGDRRALVRIALRWCLARADRSIALVGFTSPEQVEMNLTCLGPKLSADELALAREVSSRTQAALDAMGEVFVDEVPAKEAPAAAD